MFHTFEQAAARLGERDSRKVGNNTYLKRLNEKCIALRLHDTNVIEWFKEGGLIVLTSGGWRTVTTKDRLNAYQPYHVYTIKGTWLVDGPLGKTYTFADGLTIHRNGKVSNAGEPVDTKKVSALKRKVGQYAKDFTAALLCGDVPAPGGGDCWSCALHDDKGRPMGEFMNDSSHILSHIEEKYYVGALAFNAVEMFGGSRALKGSIQAIWEKREDCIWPGAIEGPHGLTKYIRRYCLRQLGFQV